MLMLLKQVNLPQVIQVLMASCAISTLENTLKAIVSFAISIFSNRKRNDSKINVP